MSFRSGIFFSFFFMIISFTGCVKNAGNSDNFEREAMITDMADIIVARYEILNTSVTELATTIQTFTDSPSINNLQEARARLLSAQLAWQATSTFEFGPAGMRILRTSVNTYPIDTALIAQNIANASYNLDAAANLATKGFPALDYLLFGTGNSEPEIVQFFLNDSLSQNRRAYLDDVSDHISANVTEVYNEWTGSYADDFKNRTGTDVGSALGMVVNALNLDLEKYIRSGKIGIPLGVRSLGNPLPEKTEAYYSGNSLQLAIESVAQLKDLFLGISPDGSDGNGLSDYLEFLGAQHSGQSLANKIENQFDEILAALNNLNDPLSQEIINNEAGVQNAYDKFQQIVVFLKLDMSSAMGVLITYQDNDGD